MNYNEKFAEAVSLLKREGRYRVFADIQRQRGAFPAAAVFDEAGVPKQITVWCSNDYLGMGQHPSVIKAMHDAFVNEDFPLIEAAGRAMETTDFLSLNPVLISSDAAPVKVRRIVKALIEQEKLG